MGAIQEYIKSAISSIRGNKARSFLTMLGIIIGITSVLVILIMGDGVEASMKQELSKGVTNVSVKLLPTKTDKYITRDAYRHMEETFEDDALGIDTALQGYGNALDYRGTEHFAQIRGGGVGYKYTQNYTLVGGRYFTEDDVYFGEMVCVIAESGAKALFGYLDVVGQEINITDEDKSYQLTVVGVRKDGVYDTQMLLYGNLMMDVPYTALCTIAGYDPDAKITSISLVCDGSKRDELGMKAPRALENILEIRGENAVKLEAGNELGGIANILSMVKSVVILIAAISLLVGGIGVMNIMTVSVTERTREIGIRKSLGARTSSIMVQFLSEAAILTAIGGFVGMALGLGIAYGASKLAGLPYVVNFSSVAIVVGISVFIGLFFGIAPAHKAAKLNPIDALHQD